MTDLNRINNVILFTRGTMGDIYPFLRMGESLKLKGLKVTLVSNYCYREYAEKSGFVFVSLDDKESFEILNNPDAHTDREKKLRLFKDHIIANIPREVGLVERVLDDLGSTAIVANSNDIFTPMLIAEKCNLPIYMSVLAPSYLYGFALFEGAALNLSENLNKMRASLGLSSVNDWNSWLKACHGYFAFWPDWFSSESVDYVSDRINYLGFLEVDSVENMPLQPEIISFINNVDDGIVRKVVLLTHGTSRPFNEEYFRVGVEACNTLNCKLIVTTPFRNFLPEILPDNIFFVDFCPFHELLSYVDAVIHHGGIGTVRECISHGVSQLVIGRGFDRQHNGRIIKELHLGDCISPNLLSKDVVCEKLKLLLDNEVISLECEKYKRSLCASDLLEDFCSVVKSGKSISLLSCSDVISNDSHNEPSHKCDLSNDNKNSILEPASCAAMNREALIRKLLNQRIKK